MSKSIQVSKIAHFEENEWRKAITLFLHSLWSGEGQVNACPKLCLGNVWLKRREDGYHAIGTSNEVPPKEVNLADSIIAGPEVNDVEIALIKFVKDDSINAITIVATTGSVTLWKYRKRGRFGISCIGIPELDPVLITCLKIGEAAADFQKANPGTKVEITFS